MICKKTEDERAYCPDRYELLQIIETMQRFLLFPKDRVIVSSYEDYVARIIDQHFGSSLFSYTSINTSQHKSTRINTSLTRNNTSPTRVNTSPTRVNTSPTRVNMNQHASKTSLDLKK